MSKTYRIRLGAYQGDTSFPIELTPKEAELFKDIQYYCEKNKTANWLRIEEEKNEV